MTKFNGKSIIYDEIGNSLEYRDNMKFSWSGRQLSAVKDGSNEVFYTYNSDGIRTSKTVNGVTTNYHLEGAKIVAETTEDVTIWYLYDENDTVVGFEYKDSVYYFEKNAKGDILRIYDENGNVVSEYIYDAWGNVVEVQGDKELASINPFRYRGYYQDNETGFYYLQSRYYDSYVGRFLNADKVLGYGNNMLSYNLYMYCSNNCVNYIDPLGDKYIEIPQFVGMYGLKLVGKELIAKLTSYLLAAFPYLIIGVAAIVTAAVIAYTAYTVYMTSTKILADVKLKKPSEKNKVYQFAYVTDKGSLVRVYGKMTYAKALAYAFAGTKNQKFMVMDIMGIIMMVVTNFIFGMVEL